MNERRVKSTDVHIVLYHDALIPPKKYGGTERVIDWLCRGLISLGHRVSLIVREGSAVPGAQIIPLTKKTKLSWEKLIPFDADITHLWATPPGRPNYPYLVTISGNGHPGEKFLPNTIFISRKHASNHGSTHYVYNGIDPDDYACDKERGDSLVFLAKASWKVKNLKGAIEIARAAGLRLEVMGNRDWPFRLQRYWNWRGVRYRGMVDNSEKREVLRHARGLIFPVLWDEPFGLAVVEALASGCPVFATPYGSLPELVDQGVGVLSNQAEELLNGIRNRRFSPELCRQRVLQHFTHSRMAKNYIEYYEKILKFGTLTPSLSELPETRYSHSPEQPMSWKSLP